MRWKWLPFASALVMGACSSDPAGNNLSFADSGPTADAGPTSDVATNSDVATADAAADMSTNADMQSLSDLGSDVGMSDMATPLDMASPSGVFVGTGDPYAVGSLTIGQTTIADGAGGPPVPLTVYAPDSAGMYPVIVFQHGFSLLEDFYSTLLTHVASHGFVVVAPQMYTPSFFGSPTAAEEAVDARALYDWVIASLDAELNVDVATDHLGLAGHSRGAKVVWLALEAGFTGAAAAAGVDPVDGRGGPLGNEARVLDGGLMTTLPSLFLGTELGLQTVLGQACAPQGDNYEAFYDAAASPAYLAYAEGYGHLDMLDDQTPGCGITCSGCVDGPTDGAFRTFAAGQLVAFFRWQLQGNAAAANFLTDTTGAPVTTQLMNK